MTIMQTTHDIPHNIKAKDEFMANLADVEFTEEESFMVNALIDDVLRNIESDAKEKFFALANDGDFEQNRRDSNEENIKTFKAFTEKFDDKKKRDVALVLMDAIRSSQEYYARRAYEAIDCFNSSSKLKPSELYSK